MMLIAAVFGWRRPDLDPDASAFFSACQPFGFILFREACVSRGQVRALVSALQEAAGHEALIFIDQEGGRVARLRPPEWPVFPAAAVYGQLYGADRDAGLEACWLGYRLIAEELRSIGVRADCAPCLDLAAAGGGGAIGDRAFSADPEAVAALGGAALAGLRAGGVAGVLKHLPGHGRADADSHFSLPRVGGDWRALQADLHPFHVLAQAPMAMTAHVAYDVIDPGRAGTQSAAVVQGLIREHLGFEGLLLTDDLSMRALAGAWWEKADAAFAAGVDIVVHGSGDLAEMEAVASAVPPLAGKALDRAEKAHAAAHSAPEALDRTAAARLQALLVRAGLAAV
jgi:beta-N-acetylhexosaminidase